MLRAVLHLTLSYPRSAEGDSASEIGRIFFAHYGIFIHHGKETTGSRVMASILWRLLLNESRSCC